MPGTLFVVATPIGNLEDLSFRALRTLREVQLIAAEDTRRTAKLLAHYGVRCPMVSLREHNEHRETPRLVARLAAGESIALVSDAGTPTIADPGTSLIRAARAQGIRVVPIPGPSAITSALSASGLPSGRFLFLGFPPRSGTARRVWLETLAAEPGTVICFEAPHRVQRTLADIQSMAVKRPIITCRELTKIHETLVEYTNTTGAKDVGEFTILIGPVAGDDRLERTPDFTPAQLSSMLHCLVESQGLGPTEATNLLATAVGVQDQALRKLIKKHRISVKQQNKSAP